MTKDFAAFSALSSVPLENGMCMLEGTHTFCSSSQCQLLGFLVPLMQCILFLVTDTLTKVSWYFLAVVTDCTACVDFTLVEIFETF